MPRTRGGYSKKSGKRPQESNRRHTNEGNTTTNLGCRRRPILDTNNSSDVTMSLEDSPKPDQPLGCPSSSSRPASSHTESLDRTPCIIESNQRYTNEENNTTHLGCRRRPIPDTNNSSGVTMGLEDFPIPDQPLGCPSSSSRPASSHTESLARTPHIIESTDFPRRVRTGRGLNQNVSIPPPGSNSLEIYIEDGAILPGNKPPRVIGRICKNYVQGPWYQWSEVKKSIRDLMFKDFKKRFNWDMSIEDEMREIFEDKCKGLWADMMNKARNNIMRKNNFTDISQLKDHPPGWCGIEDWNVMVKKWSSEDWRKKSITNYNNRMNDNSEGVVKHVGGSISMPEHKRRITESEGETPNPYELGLHKKQRDAEGNKIKDDPFVDPKSARIADKYQKMLDEKYVDDPSKKPAFDGLVWVDAVGGMKKGRVYGFGDGLQSFSLVGVAPGSCSFGGGSRLMTEESMENMRSQLEENMLYQLEMEKKLNEQRELELDAVRLEMNNEMEAKLEQQRRELEERMTQRMMEQQRTMEETIHKMLHDRTSPNPANNGPGS